MTASNYFPFEQLDVYKLSVSCSRRVRRITWPGNCADLKDQAFRASASMTLNLAEGWERGRTTNAGRNHFRIAKGSAGETFAVLDILDIEPELRADLQRVGAMLARLSR